MKRKLILIILLCINLTVFGQHYIGIKANAGLSKISHKHTYNPMNSTRAIQFAPSGLGGAFYNFQPNSNSIIGGELLFVQMEGKENFKTDFIDRNGNITGQSNAEAYWHISYLSLPVYYGLKVNKLAINIGVQGSIALASSARSKGHSSYPNEETWDIKYKNILLFKRFDFGPRAGIIYNLTDKFSIEGTYYHGINNIIRKEISKEIWRTQQATVGLRYTFFATAKNEKE